MYEDLLKTVRDGGSAVAVIAVVILFLNSQAKMYATIQAIAEHCASEISKVRELFQAQIDRIMHEVSATQHETAEAVKGLDASVRRVEETLRNRDEPPGDGHA